MDLLAGYGSSSDEDDGDHHHDTTKAVVGDKKSTPSSSSLPSTTAVVAAAAGADADASEGKKINSKLTAKKKATSAEQRKGKKLLKLSAVLPPHIFNQLTGGAGGAGGRVGGDGYGSSDDEDNTHGHNDNDQDPNVAIPEKKKKKKIDGGASDGASAELSASAKHDSSGGLLGLLQALPKSKTQSRDVSKPSIGLAVGEGLGDAQDNSGGGGVGGETNALAEKPSLSSPADSAPLGAAFVTSTVETVTRKRRKPGEGSSSADVVDIHGSLRRSSMTKPVDADPASAVDSAEASYANKLQERRRQQQQYSSIPRPQVRSVTSLPPPPPPPPPPSQGQYKQQGSQPSYYSGLNQQHSQYQQYTHQQQQGSYPGQNTSVPTIDGSRGSGSSGSGGGGGTKKSQSRKRQMEQMLRAGKIDEIQGDHQLEMESNQYHLSGDLGGGGSAGDYNAHGIKVVPTSSYQASAGTTMASTDVNLKQKSKHQLNSLLANAASLEAARAQNPLHTSKANKSHRASAKRRYGW